MQHSALSPKYGANAGGLPHPSYRRPLLMHAAAPSLSRPALTIPPLITHHKAGCVMSHIAAAAVNKERAINKSVMTVDCSERGEWQHSDPAPVCFLHVERNPFEMIVSGYLYHMSGAEAWTRRSTMDARNVTATWVGRSHKEWHSLYAFTTLAVRDASVKGHLAAELPEAFGNESYQQYLLRIPPDAGLLAEYVRASQKTLPFLVIAHDAASRSRCSLNVCSSRFEGDRSHCREQWHAIFTKLFPSQRRWQVGLLASAASTACLDGSQRDHWHQSEAQMTRYAAERSEGESHALPTARGVSAGLTQRLLKLDAGLLNHSLAAYSSRLGCELGTRYTS